MAEPAERTSEPYTVDEARARLGNKVGRNSMYDAIKCGQIPCIKIGRRILVPRAAFDRLVEAGNLFNANAISN